MPIEFEDLVINRTPPVMDIEIQQRVFEQTRAEYLSVPHVYLAEVRMFIRLLRFRPGMRILEIGAGLGMHLFELANLGARCVDVDICPGNAPFGIR